MNNKRPKNLNLATIHFPIPAIVSILHRISGFFLFLLIPVMLYLFQLSLTETGFDEITSWLSSFFVKTAFWVFLAALCFHIVAGVRHLLSDLHVGDTLKMGRLTAYLVFVVFIILAILAGVWLW